MLNEDPRIEKAEGETHWIQVRRIFEEAVALPTAQRAMFLDSRCADVAVRQEVEELLRHESDAGDGFLRPPPADQQLSVLLMRDDAPDPLIGHRVAGYAIKSRIARGGMGSVYLAEQASPRRDVALKLMHAGLWSRSAEKRFEFESQILARLHHPNIAQVYEAGTALLGDQDTRNVPYFAMEHIQDGRSITQYADERHLCIRDRLHLIVQVCDAVAYAHSKGVLHRDLKPGNVLVDDGGCAKVIDFGVARTIDSDVAVTTMHTDAGQLIGTLAYMSPEQCDADPLGLDIRSDVYSLGVVLYELLCGQLPYEVSKTSIYAATKAIKEAQPSRPSTIKGRGTGSQQVKGDLETIVLKCLEKERARRYASASEMAADVRRYLNGELISARPPTHWTRAVHWVLRHPRMVTAATCALIAGLSFGATKLSIWFWNQRPYEVVVTPDGKEARLNARSGAMLHAWRAADGGGIGFAKLFDSVSTRDKGGVVVLGMTGPSDPAKPPGLYFFRSGGPYDQPLLRVGIAREELPASVLNKKEDISGQYGVAIAKTFDVFPDIPGDEIVAGFTSTFSPSPIRIYSPAGELLFEAWHDGVFCDFSFMPAKGLLLCAALGSEAYWTERGHETTKTADPLVVFAIRPQRGYRSSNFIRGDSSTGAVRCEWYKAVSVKPGTIDQSGRRVPADALFWSTIANRVVAFAHAAPPLNDGRHVQVCMQLQREIYGVGQAGIVWTIDDLGAVIPKETHWNDSYTAAIDKGTVPRPEVFCLNELPPLARGPTSVATQPYR